MIKATPLSKKKIEDFSNLIRNHFGLQDPFLQCEIVNILENKLPTIDSTYSFEIKEKKDMNGCMAYYDVINNKIIVEESVYENAIQGKGRDRFTLAHELGHFFLHNNEMLLARDDSNDNIRIYENPEWQANTFASYLLLPRTKLSIFSNYEEIASHYGTSRQAAKIAYQDIKKPNY